MPCPPYTRKKILSLFLLSLATFVSSQLQWEDNITLTYDVSANGDIIYNYFGSRKNLLSDDEIKLFGLAEEDGTCLDLMAEKFKGNKPNHCLYATGKTASDTVLNFVTWHFDLPTAEYSIENVTLLGKDEKEVIGVYEPLKHTEAYRAFKAIYSKKKYTNTISHINTSGTKTGFDVKVNMYTPVISATFSYAHSFGNDTVEKSTQELVLGGDVFVVVDPFTITHINVSYWEEFWSFQVTYIVSLHGYAVADFSNQFEGHYFYRVPMTDLARGPRRFTEIQNIKRVQATKTLLSFR